MKIFLKLPVLGEKFNHDAPLYKIIKTALPAFILISSLTVFAGVKIHASEFLIGKAAIIAWPGYGFAYLIFSLAPDLLNAVLVAYIVRSLLNKKFHYTDIVLNIAALSLVVFLSIYSFNMSRFSASSVATEIAPDEDIIDLSSINEDYQNEIAQIESNYNNEINQLNAGYSDQITAVEAAAAKQVKSLRNNILSWERKRKPANTQWIDTKIAKLNNDIAAIEQSAATDRANLLKEKQQKIDQKGSFKNARISNLENQKKTDRNTTSSLKEKANEEKALATTYLKKQLSRIAGFAVFIVLVLASLKEVIHFRNDIKPTPILSNLDFQTDWLKEVLLLPFVTVQRKLINNVRTKYEALPDLKEPPAVLDIVEYNIDQKKLPSEKLQLLTNQEKGYFFGRKTGVPFIAHENSAKNEVKNENCSGSNCNENSIQDQSEWQLLQRLKMYKKRVGEHEQKAKLQLKNDGFIKKRTQSAIDNNKAKVAEFEALLNHKK